MADVSTTIISGVFTVAGSLASIWLKDYLERRKEARPATAPQPAPAAAPGPASSPVGTEVPETGPVPSQAPTLPPVARAASAPGWRRPVLIALTGFLIGVVSSFVRPMLSGPMHPEAIGSLMLLILIALFGVAHHAGSGPGRGVIVFELEMVSLWAAFVFGWSLVHGSLWSDFVAFGIVGWLGSAVGGLVLIPLVRSVRRPSA